MCAGKVKSMASTGGKGKVVGSGGKGKGGKVGVGSIGGKVPAVKAVTVVQRPEPYVVVPRPASRPEPPIIKPDSFAPRPTKAANMAAQLATARALAESKHAKADDIRELLAVKDKGWIDDRKFSDLLMDLIF